MDANFGEYSGGGGGGHPIGACHVCPLHSPAKRRVISVKKRAATSVAADRPTMTMTTTDVDGKKNGNFNFPPKDGPSEGPGNELSGESGDHDDNCGGKANGGCSVASASASAGED